MSKRLSDEEKQIRGVEAQRLLENPLLIEALQIIQDRYRLGLETACPSKPDELQHWSRSLKCGRLFEDHLLAVIKDGEDAEKVIKYNKEKKRLFS